MEERIDIMTDYQMRVILNMIIDIIREKKDPEKIIERIIAIRDGTADTKSENMKDGASPNR